MILIIAHSQYDDKNLNMPSADADHDAILDLVEDSNLSEYVECTVALNFGPEKLNHTIKKFRKNLQDRVRKNHEKVFGLVYFTGHGQDLVIYGSEGQILSVETHAVNCDGKTHYNLAKLARLLGGEDNTQIVAIYDCCRLYPATKSLPGAVEEEDDETLTKEGCYTIIYSSKEGKASFAGDDGGVSKLTKGILDLIMEEKTLKMPDGIQFNHKFKYAAFTSNSETNFTLKYYK